MSLNEGLVPPTPQNAPAEPPAVSVGDDRLVTFTETFSVSLADTIGSQYVGAGSEAMFLDLPEQFRQCFEARSVQFSISKSIPEKETLRRLRQDLASLNSSFGKDKSKPSGVITEAQNVPMRPAFRPDLNGNSVPESESEDSSTDDSNSL
jgi:hypothetical protein